MTRKLISRRFVCEACGRIYAWSHGFAGKRVRCACGHVMTAPFEMPEQSVPEDVDGDGSYELADVPPGPSPAASNAHHRRRPLLAAPSKGGEGAVNPV
jgi:hypothetical protein